MEVVLRELGGWEVFDLLERHLQRGDALAHHWPFVDAAEALHEHRLGAQGGEHVLGLDVFDLELVGAGLPAEELEERLAGLQLHHRLEFFGGDDVLCDQYVV